MLELALNAPQPLMQLHARFARASTLLERMPIFCVRAALLTPTATVKATIQAAQLVAAVTLATSGTQLTPNAIPAPLSVLLLLSAILPLALGSLSMAPISARTVAHFPTPTLPPTQLLNSLSLASVTLTSSGFLLLMLLPLAPPAQPH
jgi:hypothetical protein